MLGCMPATVGVQCVAACVGCVGCVRSGSQRGGFVGGSIRVAGASGVAAQAVSIGAAWHAHMQGSWCVWGQLAFQFGSTAHVLILLKRVKTV